MLFLFDKGDCLMSIREQLAQGIFEESQQTTQVAEAIEWEVPESNPFELKQRTRLDRMLKSERARKYRHKVKDIKQKRYQLGFNTHQLKY